MNALRTDSTRTSARTARRVAGFAALPLLASLTLVGCASDDRDDAPANGRSASSSAATDTASGSATGTASNDALLAAVETARTTVGSGTVLSVEQEQNASAYEVLLVTSNGDEHEVHTNAAGTEVQGSPRTERSDAEDKAENDRFVSAADLDVAEAVQRFEDLHAGTITELGLDDHLGAVVWEGDVRDSSGTKHSVRIDAGSGKVVTDAVDTDD